MALGRLSVILDANIAKFESDLGRANRIAHAQSRDIQQSFEKAGRAIGLSLSAGVAVLAISVKKSIDGMLQLGTAAKQVGMPVEQFTALSAVAKRADVDVQSFTAAMLAADRALAQARSGTGAQAQAFKALGIDPKQVKDNNDLILKAADALSKYRDGVGKSAVEMTIFGKSGAELNAFLDQGSRAIQEQTQHMQELGVAFGPDAQAQLAAFDNAQKEFSDTITGLRNRIAIALLPTLQSATDFLAGMVKSMDKQAVSGFTEVINTLARAALVVAGAFDVAGKSIGGTLAVIKAGFEGYDWKKDGVGPGAALTVLARNFGNVRTAAKVVGADINATISQWTQRIASFGDAAAKATAKASGGDTGRKTLTFNPNADAMNAAAASKAKALAQAYDALAVAAQKANEKQLSPKDKALADYTEGVRQLAKAAGDYVAKGGDAAKATELFLKGKAGLADAYANSLARINAEMKAYADNLNHEVDLQKNAIDIQVASIGMGQKEAEQLQKINDIRIRGAEAVQKLQQDLAQHPEQSDTINKQIELQKQQTEDLVKVTTDGYAKMDAARANGANGFKSAIADFMDDMQDNAKRMKDFTTSMVDGFSDAFARFASGTESAKKAFGDWIDSMFQQALKFLANKAIQALFDTAGAGSSETPGASPGWGNLFSNFANALFGGGKAVGGYVAPMSMYRVNERGPELLSVGGRDFLMMGAQGGTVTPNNRLGGGVTVNVAVRPTTTRRTADQVATAVARQQRIATSRNG